MNQRNGNALSGLNPPQGLRKQQGVALIVVLLVMALVAITATDMGSRLQYQVKRSISLKDNNQAYWYAIAAEQFAQKTIAQLVLEGNESIHINEPWAQEDIQFPMPGGFIEATLEDLQSCFNLNALRTKNTQGTTTNLTAEAFGRLLRTESLNIPTFNQDTLKDSLVDWVDDDSQLEGNYGAEDSDYESLVNPYLAANSMMASKSELRLVKGVEFPWLLDMMPLVCVVPELPELKVNVNTFTPEKAPVLAAIADIEVSAAENLISGIPYDTPAEFLATAEMTNSNLPDQEKNSWFATKTQFFILHVTTAYNSGRFKMSSVFKVDGNNNVSVIRREFGGKI